MVKRDHATGRTRGRDSEPSSRAGELNSKLLRRRPSLRLEDSDDRLQDQLGA